MTDSSGNKKEKIAISADGLRLQGVLHLPAAAYPPLVIGCHGLLADKSSPKQIALAEACNRRQMAYFRFDHRGCGESQGEFLKATNLEARCRDLAAALCLLGSRGDLGRGLGLFGSSMGGAVCLASGASLAAGAVVTLAAPVRLELPPLRSAKPSDEMSLPYDFYKNNLAFDLSPQLANLHDILVLHGDADEVVPVSNAHEIQKHAQAPKKLLIFKNGDHRISQPQHQQEFIAAAVEWFAMRLTP